MRATRVGYLLLRSNYKKALSREDVDAPVKLILNRLSKLQIEVSNSYALDKSKKRQRYAVETYLFFPKRLGINAETYPQYLFYRDLQAYSELMPAPQSLSDILSPTSGLLSRLNQSIDLSRHTENEAEVQQFEYQNRAFCHIAHSAVDRQVQQIMASLGSEMASLDSANCPLAVEEYLQLTRQLREDYREIETALAESGARPQSLGIFLLSDEYLSLVVEDANCRLAEALQTGKSNRRDPLVTRLYETARGELEYRSHRGYASVPDHKGHNEALVYQREGLRTYIRSVFSLTNRNKPESRLGRELLLSMAAGVAMVFATAVAFLAHVQYENWTTTFFVVLVVSYMFKDRIKAMAQDYLNTKGRRFFYDFRTTLYGQATSRPLGILKESFSFIPAKKLPPDVLRLRKHSRLAALNNDYCGERTLLYKRKSILYPTRLVDACSGSEVEGICQIQHFDFTRFARKMESRKSNVFTPHDGAYRQEASRRVYHLHLVIKYQAGATTSYQHFRIVMSRGGILRIEDLAEPSTRPDADPA